MGEYMLDDEVDDPGERERFLARPAYDEERGRNRAEVRMDMTFGRRADWTCQVGFNGI